MKTQVKTKFNLPKFEFQHEFERSRKLIYYQEGENKYNYKYTNTTTNTQIQLQIHKYNFQEADVLWGGGGQPVPDRAGRRLVHRHLEQQDQQLLSHWNLFGIKTHWRQLLVVCQYLKTWAKVVIFWHKRLGGGGVSLEHLSPIFTLNTFRNVSRGNQVVSTNQNCLLCDISI